MSMSKTRFEEKDFFFKKAPQASRKKSKHT